MFRLFHRHHVRATFYHVGILLFLAASLLNYTGHVSDLIFKWFCIGLIVIDYIAEMYDPHPDNPGPWFKSHFHRFFNDDG